METPDFKKFASRFLNTTASHIFLTGKAGTGKTTFLKSLAEHTHKNFIVVAPTGIAALNAGGVTIHSQFLIPPATFIPDRYLPENLTAGGRYINSQTLARKHPLNSLRKQVLRAIDLLVIDEVSMLRADLLDAIDYRMKAARGNFNQSFGGVQVLFIGDLFQLPPVVRNDEQELLSRYYSIALVLRSLGFAR
jgi:GTPase SAR1 family protein